MPNIARYFLVLLLAVATTPTVQAQSIEPPPLDAYGELPGIEDAAISPSGKLVSTVSRVQETRTLMFLDNRMELLRILSVGDLKVRSIEWIGEEAVLFVSSETEELGFGFTADSYEAVSAMIVPLDEEKEMEVVFADSKGIVDSIFGRHGIRFVHGTWTGFFGGVALERSTFGGRYLAHARPTLFAVDLEENKAEKAAHHALANHWRDWLIDSDGQVAATFDIDRRSGEWEITDPKKKVIASGINPRGEANLVALGHDGTSLIFATEMEEDVNSRWYNLPLDGSGTPSEIFAGEDIDRIFVDRISGRLIGYLRGESKPSPVFFDPSKQEAAEKIYRAFEGLDVNIVDWTPQFSHVIVRTSGNGDSGTWFLVDLSEMKAGGIGRERSRIPASQVGPISTFRYTAGDGLELDGILTLPPGHEARNLPAIMFPHGGPNNHDKEQFNWWAQAFASRGYAVFQPNFRGSTNRDENFLRAGDGQWGKLMQSDISDGLKALAQEGIVDPDRACIMGASYGGYAALAGVTLEQGIYQCSVAVAPVSDVEMMYWTDYRESGRSSVARRALTRQFGPRSELDEISPRQNADRADAPILLIHGRDDIVVPFEQSEKMADALDDANKPFKLVELEEEDHWLSRSATRKQMLEEAMAFVQQHNPAD